jgi:hypothetical protein
VILDTKGNILGGLTPVEWESRTDTFKADDSLKSFVFTLKNPHNIPARRFALKVERKDDAINCESGWGPRFGFCDIGVFDNCNANTASSTSLGSAYTNDTGLGNDIVLADFPSQGNRGPRDRRLNSASRKSCSPAPPESGKSEFRKKKPKK